MAKSRILVTGAGGFIGHHLVRRLKSDGYWVRGYEQTASINVEIPVFQRGVGFRQLVMTRSQRKHLDSIPVSGEV